MKLLIIDPLGMYICRHGTREQGQTFDGLSDDLVNDLAEQYPNRCEKVKDEQASVPQGRAEELN
jgi:hypothetical protein